VAALAVPVTGAAVAKPPKAPKPTPTPKPNPGAGQISLTATPNPVVYAHSTVLSGRLGGGQVGGQSVVIEANPAPFAGFQRLESVTTQSNGSYSATVRPLLNTRYRVTAQTAPPVTSAEVLVAVNIRVSLRVSDSTPSRGRKVTFSGTASPAHNGATVSIQRRGSTGSYGTVARTTLVADGTTRSRYRRSLRISRSATYRVKVSTNDADHGTGVSSARTLTVH